MTSRIDVSPGLGSFLNRSLFSSASDQMRVDEALLPGLGVGAVVPVRVELVQRVAGRDRRPLQAPRDADEHGVTGLRVDAHLHHRVGPRPLAVTAGVRPQEQQVDAPDVGPGVRRLGLRGRGLQGGGGEAAHRRAGEDGADDVPLDEGVAHHLERGDGDDEADERGEGAQPPGVGPVTRSGAVPKWVRMIENTQTSPPTTVSPAMARSASGRTATLRAVETAPLASTNRDPTTTIAATSPSSSQPSRRYRVPRRPAPGMSAKAVWMTDRRV